MAPHKLLPLTHSLVNLPVFSPVSCLREVTKIKKKRIYPSFLPPSPSTLSPLSLLSLLPPPSLPLLSPPPSQIEAQIVALVAGSRMPDSTLRDHLRLCLRLQHILQSTFPSLMLVPFGAPVSGQATVTSDCDLCLITEPTSQDRRFLTGSEYYSEKHCTMLDDLAVELTTPTSDATPTHPLGALARDEYHHDDYDMSESGSSTSSPSPGATPTSYSQRSRSCPREFDALLAAVKRNPDCCKVHPIPFARCPIVRFLWEPSGTHCDLSINNRYMYIHVCTLYNVYMYTCTFTYTCTGVPSWADESFVFTI